jgi:hypothetical protein
VAGAVRRCALLAACFAVRAYAQTRVQFETVSRVVVERRLQAFDGNDTEREGRLKQMFLDAGCAPEHLEEHAVKGLRQPNVSCLLPGSSDQLVIVGAHLDHIDEGHGVVDNWTGALLLPTLLQGLKGQPRTKSFWFVGFVGEEKGLVGSQAFAASLSDEQIGRTVAMVNLDTLGLGPTLVWQSQSDPVLVSILAQMAKASSLPVSAMDLDGVGMSDEESFIARKVCSVSIHSVTPESWRILHSPADKLSAVKLDDYYASYRLIQAYLAALDTMTIQKHVCKAVAIEPGGGMRVRSQRRR